MAAVDVCNKLNVELVYACSHAEWLHLSCISEHTKKEQLMDIVAGVQGSRINDQRANFPGLRNRREVMSQLLSDRSAGQGDGVPDDNFFDQLMRCQVSI